MAIEQAAEVYLVTVQGRADGTYVFECYEDAVRFKAAVEFDRGVAFLSEEPVGTTSSTNELIDAELSDVQDEDGVTMPRPLIDFLLRRGYTAGDWPRGVSGLIAAEWESLQPDGDAPDDEDR